MAYVSKEKKAKAMAALKLAIPKSWKWSLSVHNHSTLVLTIYSAPIDLLAEYRINSKKEPNPFFDGHADVNHYHYERWMEGSKVLPTFKKIVAAMNVDNYDRSEIQFDHHDVGHYVKIGLGRWNKPFEVK